MHNFIKIENPFYADGIIVVEWPHRGPRRVWSARDDADALSRIQRCAERSDTGEYDISDIGGALDWNGHDLRWQDIIYFSDVDSYINGTGIERHDVLKEAVCLDWVKQEEGEEDA